MELVYLRARGDAGAVIWNISEGFEDGKGTIRALIIYIWYFCGFFFVGDGGSILEFRERKGTGERGS